MSFRVNTNLGALNALRNLGQTGVDYSKSVSRLSTGLRIATAADDPAGLIISEGFRSQIAGLEQASQNNQDAVNYAKTAEGALDEVSRLLRDARKLAVASGSTGTLDSNAIQANQNQITSILASIDRIAGQTAFGSKKLLDGSAGVSSSVTNAANYGGMNIGGTFGGYAVNASGTVTVQVTQAATRAVVTGSVGSLTAATVLGAGNFVLNGQSFTTNGTETVQGLVTRFNNASSQTGVTAALSGGSVVFSSNDFGLNAKISLTDTGGILNGASFASATGVEARATVSVTTSAGVTAALFTGSRGSDSGLRLTDANGNAILLTQGGNAVAAAAAVGRIEAGSAQFQIGANAGQFVNLSLSNMQASQIGTGIVSGQSLASISVTSATGADDALKIIDGALAQVAKGRGDIGNFQRNVLESNNRSLGIQRENLIASESAIRDADVAVEITNFTKLQILQSAGLSILAQANAAPQSVLSLLR